MGRESRWLGLTLPVAAFLGSAVGVVVGERYLGGGRSAPVVLADATPVQAAPPVNPPVPSRVLPAAEPALDSPDSGPELPLPSGPRRPPSPAAPAGTDDDGLPPIPDAKGRSPFPPAPGGAPDPDAPAAPVSRSPFKDEVDPRMPQGANAGRAPFPGGDAALPEADAGQPDEMLVDPIGTYARSYPLPPDYFDITKLPKRDGPAMPVLQPGQWVQVEVLEALPGRPISGRRLIRPDGTISLGWYGDLAVAGLNRDQIKVKLLDHLNKFMTEAVLGFYIIRGTGDQVQLRPAVESDRVFIDESMNFAPPDSDLREQVKALTAKIDQLLQKTLTAKPAEAPAGP